MEGTDEFTVNLISSASMDIFPNNTLASFRNFFNEALILEGDWRVALTEIIFPAQIANVTTKDITVYTTRGYERTIASRESGVISKDKYSRYPYLGEHVKLTTGVYEDVLQLLQEIKDKGNLTNFEYETQKVSEKLVLKFGKHVGITFPDPEIPSILGFIGVKDARTGGVHIGWKMDKSSDANLDSKKLQTFTIDYSTDLSAGSQLMFVYVDIIGYQVLGDTKAPLLRVIDTNRRLKNGSICSIEPTHRKVFSNLDYKKLFSTTIQSISVQLRTETGKLVPFLGTGKVILSLKFKKFGS